VPIRWPRSRDEVWKANIPHTHLASEKSDQRWMVVNGAKINFPGGGTHFHAGADKYIVHLAQVRNVLLSFQLIHHLLANHLRKLTIAMLTNWCRCWSSRTAS
jgi:hypothetical protein